MFGNTFSYHFVFEEAGPVTHKGKSPRVLACSSFVFKFLTLSTLMGSALYATLFPLSFPRPPRFHPLVWVHRVNQVPWFHCANETKGMGREGVKPGWLCLG